MGVRAVSEASYKDACSMITMLSQAVLGSLLFSFWALGQTCIEVQKPDSATCPWSSYELPSFF